MRLHFIVSLPAPTLCCSPGCSAQFVSLLTDKRALSGCLFGFLGWTRACRSPQTIPSPFEDGEVADGEK